MPDKARDKLIKHYNNPASPKQKKKFEAVAGVPLPAPIIKIQGANWAIQAVIRTKKAGTPMGDTILTAVCFATEYDTNGIAIATSIPETLRNPQLLRHFYAAKDAFAKAAMASTMVVGMDMGKDPFAESLTVSRTRITERL
jgi:hypothetical protein